MLLQWKKKWAQGNEEKQSQRIIQIKLISKTHIAYTYMQTKQEVEFTIPIQKTCSTLIPNFVNKKKQLGLTS